MPKKYPFALEWTPELVGDFKREIFDEYFHGDFSVEQWQKVLQTGKRCVGMQRVELRNKPKSGRGKALNRSELGRLCYFLQFTPKVFNSIFATDILASHIPTSEKGFCKQSLNEEQTNIYLRVEEIFLRHAIPMFYPKMEADNWRKAEQEYSESCDEQIRELQERIERLNANKASYASLCNQAVLHLEKGEKSCERSENSPQTTQSDPPTAKAAASKPKSTHPTAESPLSKAEGAEPFQTSLF